MSLPVLLSCENATCAVPEAFRELFHGAEERLTSPEGWDPGSLNLAQHLSREFRTPLLHGEVTRLLVDLNCAPGDPAVFGDIARRLPESRLEGLLKRHFTPYQTSLRSRVADELTRHPAVVHVSVRTFARTQAGAQVGADIGLRFDPAGEAEAGMARRWLEAMRAAAPALRIEENPAGLAGGGLMAQLKQEYPAGTYLGLGLEVCQSFFLDGLPLRWDATRKLIAAALKLAIG